MGQHERVRRAIEGPVREAEKLLAELTNPSSETKLSILISGWGRGLAAALEELAIAIDQLQHERSGAPPATPPPAAAPEQAPPQAASEEESAQLDLRDASEERLLAEAKRSREQTAEVEKESEDARRQLER
jgi:hypothetical protein